MTKSLPRTLLLYILLTFPFTCFAQEMEMPEVMPRFAGDDISSYLKSLIDYPDSAFKHRIEGRVFLAALVQPDGKLDDIKVLKGLGFGCDEVAQKVLLTTSGNWAPAQNQGKPVPFTITVPVNFRIDSATMVEKNQGDKAVFTFVDQDPVPLFDLQSYINQNIQYPRRAMENRIQGKVFVAFTIDKMGFVGSPEIIKGLGFGCDEVVLGLVNSMPRWSPGRRNHKPVKVRVNVPVVFVIPGIKGKDSKTKNFSNKGDSENQQMPESPPQFPEPGFSNFVNNQKRDSLYRLEKGEKHTVHLSFKVDTNGLVCCEEIPFCSDSTFIPEARRIVRASNGKWISGKKGDQKVVSKMYFPFHFDGPVDTTFYQPIPPRGDFLAFIHEFVIVPEKAARAKKEGTATVRFSIDRLGRIGEIVPVKIAGYGWDEEAVRLLNLSSGLWKPAMRNGLPQRVTLSIDFQFKP